MSSAALLMAPSVLASRYFSSEKLRSSFWLFSPGGNVYRQENRAAQPIGKTFNKPGRDMLHYKNRDGQVPG